MVNYRKKPVIIEAVQWDGRNTKEVEGWANGAVKAKAKSLGENVRGIRVVLAVGTLEGEMHADLGDWIIKGVKGEFYPCKPDIFAATYERVTP